MRYMRYLHSYKLLYGILYAISLFVNYFYFTVYTINLESMFSQTSNVFFFRLKICSPECERAKQHDAKELPIYTWLYFIL
jgi:hypothetical protein